MTKHDYEDTIEYINENVKLIDIIEGYGLKLRKEADGRYTMVCPFHSEDTASLKVYFNSEKNKWTFFCFGCGAGYGTIDFIKMFENIGFMDVINRYKQNITSGSGENIYQKLLKHNQGIHIDLAEYMLSSKFRLGLILREYLKKNDKKEEFVDRCFYEMDNFFENPGNLNKENIDIFEENILERINNEF